MPNRLTNAQKLRKLATLAENDVFTGAMIISKLEQLCKSAVNNPDALREAMIADGSANMIDPELVLRTYTRVLEVVALS